MKVYLFLLPTQTSHKAGCFGPTSVLNNPDALAKYTNKLLETASHKRITWDANYIVCTVY